MTIEEVKPKLYDVIDVYSKLKKEFPHVHFDIDEEPNRRNYFRLLLVGIFNQKFERPIKTTISIHKDQYLNEFEFVEVRKKMEEGFKLSNLL